MVNHDADDPDCAPMSTLSKSCPPRCTDIAGAYINSADGSRIASSSSSNAGDNADSDSSLPPLVSSSSSDAGNKAGGEGSSFE